MFTTFYLVVRLKAAPLDALKIDVFFSLKMILSDC